MRYLLIVATSIILLNAYSEEALADVSYADLFLNGKGYKPVKDTWPIKPNIHSSTPSLENGNLLDNLRYREWCITTFKNGEQIYEAYKEIAFTIEYRAEPKKTDYWQTPIETRGNKQGDCEDAVFLFFSKLSDLDIDGNIVWGWVVDKDKSISFAHVWYQLFDKRGRSYIVEGFSKEWNGIVPVDLIGGGEERVPTLILRHNKVMQMVDNMPPRLPVVYAEAQKWNMYFANTHIIRDIFFKLQDMFARYREQMQELPW
ncbi:MAG: transglutaminase domain-containing protein [Candidatus Brocadiaceae bacterium]|nr:transglutaminase domain-containing protein [Candidatus Brocadiaceae bacterium]